MVNRFTLSVTCKSLIPHFIRQIANYSICRYDIALPNGYFNLAVERNIPVHAAGRRAIAKDYSMTATLKNERYFDAVIKDFITALDKNFAQTGKKCNFTVWSEYFTYDMITDLVFGESFGFCKAARDVEGGLRDLRQMLNLSPFL